MWLLALFVAIPIVEIALFIQVGGWIGLWPTLAIVVMTAFAGTALVRTQGLGTLDRLRRSLAEGRDPMGPIAHGALILVAGVLLLTPGFFTDGVGLALLVPPIRDALIRWGAARITVIASAEMSRGTAPQPRRGDTVEAEYVVVSEDPPEAADPPEPQRRAGGASRWTRPPE
jgi:UPF0716 protein FxsA